jgi:hypothetical protein
MREDASGAKQLFENDDEHEDEDEKRILTTRPRIRN